MLEECSSMHIVPASWDIVICFPDAKNWEQISQILYPEQDSLVVESKQLINNLSSYILGGMSGTIIKSFNYLDVAFCQCVKHWQNNWNRTKVEEKQCNMDDLKLKMVTLLCFVPSFLVLKVKI